MLIVILHHASNERVVAQSDLDIDSIELLLERYIGRRPDLRTPGLLRRGGGGSCTSGLLLRGHDGPEALNDESEPNGYGRVRC
jgi:hypothetical protein